MNQQFGNSLWFAQDGRRRGGWWLFTSVRSLHTSGAPMSRLWSRTLWMWWCLGTMAMPNHFWAREDWKPQLYQIVGMYVVACVIYWHESVVDSWCIHGSYIVVVCQNPFVDGFWCVGSFGGMWCWFILWFFCRVTCHINTWFLVGGGSVKKNLLIDDYMGLHQPVAIGPVWINSLTND